MKDDNAYVSRKGRSDNLGKHFKSVWTFIGVCIIVVGVCWLLGNIASAIWTLIFSGVVVFILRKPVRWFENKGIPRMVSSAILTILLVLLILAVLVSFVPAVINQLSDLLGTLPSLIDQAQQWFNQLMQDNPNIADSTIVQSWAPQISSMVQQALSSINSNVMPTLYDTVYKTFNVLILGLMAFIIAFWILVDYDKMTHEIHVLAGPNTQWYVTLISTIFSRVLGGYLKGTLIGALITAIVSGVLFWIVGMPWAVVLGIMVGLFSIVPYLGPIVATIALGILSLFYGFWMFFWVLVISIVVPWAVGTFVSPKIMSSTVNLHPGIVMISIIAGGAIGGILGMLVAIPVVAAIKCLLVYFFETITGRQLVSKKGALFAGIATDNVDPVADSTDGELTSESLRDRINEIDEKILKSEKVRPKKRGAVMKELSNPMGSFTRDSKGFDSEASGPDESDAAAVEAPADADAPAAVVEASVAANASSNEGTSTGNPAAGESRTGSSSDPSDSK